MTSVVPAPVDLIHLPHPRLRSEVSLEEAIAGRRSTRTFAAASLTDAELGQVLWAAQGITSGRGARTAPSAGGLYPLEAYVVTSAGLAHYLPDGHRVLTVAEGDLRPALAAAALDQHTVAAAPAVIVLAAVYARTAGRYGSRAERYAALETGHAAQNVLLEAVALGLAAAPVGAFDDEAVHRVLGLPRDHVPVYLIAVGRPRAA